MKYVYTISGNDKNYSIKVTGLEFGGYIEGGFNLADDIEFIEAELLDENFNR